MHWSSSRFNAGPVLSVLGCLYIIRNAGAPRPVRFAANSLRSPLCAPRRAKPGAKQGATRGGGGGGEKDEEVFRPAIVWLAVSDLCFALSYITFMSLVGGSQGWCRAQNALWQFWASATWLWTTVMALQAMAVLLRSGRVGTLVARRQHWLTWPLAALSASPNLLDSDVDPDGFCDNRTNAPTAAATVLLLLVFAANVGVYAGGLWRASGASTSSSSSKMHLPFSVLERYSWRTFYLLAVFILCWLPFVMWNVHLWVHGVSPVPGSTLFEVTLSVQALQGFLNSVAYGVFDDKLRGRCLCQDREQRRRRRRAVAEAMRSYEEAAGGGGSGGGEGGGGGGEGGGGGGGGDGGSALSSGASSPVRHTTTPRESESLEGGGGEGGGDGEAQGEVYYSLLTDERLLPSAVRAGCPALARADNSSGRQEPATHQRARSASARSVAFTQDVTVWVFGEAAVDDPDDVGDGEEGPQRTLGDVSGGELRLAARMQPMAGGRTRLLALVPAAVMLVFLILLFTGLLVIMSKHASHNK